MFFNFFKKANQKKEESEYSSRNAHQDKHAIIQLPKTDRVFIYHIKKTDSENHNVAFFRNGVLYNVYPRNTKLTLDEDRNVAYSARYFVSDGIKYDLCNPKDIIELKMPHYEDNNGAFCNVTRNIDYILKMRAQKVYQRDLAIPTVITAINLMLISTISWSPKDYFRLISQLEGINELDYASYLKEAINEYNPSILSHELQDVEYASKTIARAHSIGSDLVELPYLACTCEECAKYQGRVYSISGNDKRYPKLPDIIKETGKVHPGCSHHLNVFFEWEKDILKYVYNSNGEVTTEYVDAIKNSNRPFIDDRTSIEIERFNKSQQKKRQRKNNFWDEEDSKKYFARAAEYDWILENLPEIAPKSLGGYTKMKHSNSKNYQMIKNEANKLGMILDDNL